MTHSVRQPRQLTQTRDASCEGLLLATMTAGTIGVYEFLMTSLKSSKPCTWLALIDLGLLLKRFANSLVPSVEVHFGLSTNCRVLHHRVILESTAVLVMHRDGNNLVSHSLYDTFWGIDSRFL